MELSIAKVHCNGNAYDIEVRSDTVTLIIGFVAVLTRLFCRRFGVAVLTMNRKIVFMLWQWSMWINLQIKISHITVNQLGI